MFNFLKPEIYCEWIDKWCPFKEELDYEYISTCFNFKKYPLPLNYFIKKEP